MVSIIIPVYKVEEYLKECIDSVIMQSYGNLEIILVEDGSPDNCPRICDGYADKDKRIKVIHKENGGLSDARNAGIRMAEGEYLFFLDSDDYLEKDAIENLMGLILSHDADIAISSYIKFGGDKYKRDNRAQPCGAKETVKTGKEAMLKLMTENDENERYVTVWGKLYKTELWRNMSFPTGRIHEDAYIMHRIYYNAKKVIASPLTGYWYRQRADSIMGVGITVKTLDVLEADSLRVDFCQQNNTHYVQAVKYYARKIIYLYYQYYDSQIEDKKNILKTVKGLARELIHRHFKEIPYNYRWKLRFLFFTYGGRAETITRRLAMFFIKGKQRNGQNS